MNDLKAEVLYKKGGEDVVASMKELRMGRVREFLATVPVEKALHLTLKVTGEPGTRVEAWLNSSRAYQGEQTIGEEGSMVLPLSVSNIDVLGTLGVFKLHAVSASGVEQVTVIVATGDIGGLMWAGADHYQVQPELRPQRGVLPR